MYIYIYIYIFFFFDVIVYLMNEQNKIDLAKYSMSEEIYGCWRKFMDVVKEDMKSAGVREEDAEDRVRWRQMIHCGDPLREKPKG